VTVRFHVQPGASRTEIVGEHGEGKDARLKIRIASPPVDGKANDALLQFLKRLTGLPTARIQLVRGETSRAKDVLFEGVSVEEILTKLSAPKTSSKNSSH
jgi:uncharacterized protein (TIGR00251 family)